MARAVLVLVLVFLALAVLRALRVLLARALDRSRAARAVFDLSVGRRRNSQAGGVRLFRAG
jgi:hypothetical protein